jgi:F0F1-type ATP synthase assembly protein I
VTDRQSQEKGPGGFGRHGAKAYQYAMEAVLAIPVAGGLGYWADVELETGPTGLVIGLGLGFVTFVLQLVRMRRLVDEIAAEAKSSHQAPGTDEDWKPRP